MKWKTTDGLDADLSASFYGTSQYYFNRLYPSMKYTDGIHFLMENGLAWLVDEIGINIHKTLAATGGFYIIVLDTKDKKATLSVCMDIDEEKLQDVSFTKKIEYTDAPEGRFKLYWQDGVLFCTSEY